MSSIRWKGVFVAGAYAFVSIFITIANKILLSTYKFKFECVLILLQLVFTTMMLFWLRAMNMIAFPNPTVAVLKKVIPMSLCFFGTVFFGLSSLRLMNVPMWAALRRQTAMLILLMDTFIYKRESSYALWTSVSSMLLGAIIAAWGDFDFNFVGYCHVFVLCLVSAYYFIVIKQCKKDTGLSEVAIMVNCNLLSIPYFLAFAIGREEFTEMISYDKWTDTRVLFWIFVSVVLAGLVNLFTFMSVNINSPLTTSVTGQAKNIMSTTVSMIIHPPPVFEPTYIMGILIGLMASISYAVVKYKENAVAARSSSSSSAAPPQLSPKKGD